MNRLAHEISPYLLQHAHNPVDWYPWGEEALAKARTEQKAIFLSIGYATCHWCHVMEGDSFEKEDVAAILNEHFVTIKVDREERPDIDSLYMKAAQAMNQRGGWPLSMALTPEGKPFWGGSFVPRQQFKQILLRLAELWKTKTLDLEDSAFELMEHLKMAESLGRAEKDHDARVLDGFLARELKAYDPEWGGFGGAPKFPPAMALLALMRIGHTRSDDRALAAVRGTLDAMARGGMRDQVGGGFHRYSVDESWLIPHFEKMLYDNALLSLAYAEAYQITRAEDYRDVVATTLDYVIRDMQLPEGGYCSAEDADSEKAEGKFYVWSKTELLALLGNEDFSIFEHYFAIEEDGNFHVDQSVEELEAAAGLKAVQKANILHQQKAEKIATLADPDYRRIIELLLEQRSKRIRPLRDDKVLTAWNGLMIAAMAKAHKVFGEERWRASAEKAADFVLNKMLRHGRLLRSHRQGQSRYHAYLEDYAGLIFGLIELYEASFESRWLKAAISLQETQDRLFWDEGDACYFDSDGEDGTLLLRTKELVDNASPAGNSLSCWNLLRLSVLRSHQESEDKARRILAQSAELLQRFPGSFPMLMLSVAWLEKKPNLCVIATQDPAALRWPDLCPDFTPHTAFLRADAELSSLCPAVADKVKAGQAQTLYYLCEEGLCQAPTADLKKLHGLLREQAKT